MRVLIGACLTGISSACLAPQFDIVSQSVSGTQAVTSAAALAAGLPASLPFNEKMDMENFNMYSTSSASIEVNTVGSTIALTSTSVMILQGAEQQQFLYTEIDQNGDITKSCTQLDPSAMLQQMQMMKQMSHAADCLGSDGTFDTWGFKLDIPGASAETEYTTTQDLLFHSMKQTMSMADGNTVESMMNVSSAQHGGPSAAELDPAQFDVECTPAPTPPNVSLMLLGQNHALAALQVALQSTQQRAEVV